MLDQMQGTNIVSFSSYTTETANEQPSIFSPSLTNFAEYKLLQAGQNDYIVSPSLEDGYLTACKAYTEMQERDECGPYIFLTGYEYAHLAKRYVPLDLSSDEKKEWQRGFIAGWVASSLGF